MDCQILLKFVTLVPYRSPEMVQWLKCTDLEIQDCRLPTNFQSLNHYNLAITMCSRVFLLNFLQMRYRAGTFEYVTADTLQTFKVEESKDTTMNHLKNGLSSVLTLVLSPELTLVLTNRTQHLIMLISIHD